MSSNGKQPRLVFVHALCGRRVYREVKPQGRFEEEFDHQRIERDQRAYDDHIATCPARHDRRSRE